MSYNTGDKVWYRYRVGGDPEQLEFTTPAQIFHSPQSSKAALIIAVFNQKTRRVVRQWVSRDDLKPRTVSHPLDVKFKAYRGKNC